MRPFVSAALLTLALAASCGEPDRPRVLVVGWDGAGFPLLDPLLDEGLLPNVADLLRRGRGAVMESTRIPISSAAWTSASTGCGSGDTGVYGFFAPRPGSYSVDLVSSESVQVPPLWRILSSRGLGVHVFGVPLTWPPEPVNGVMVAGMLAPHEGGFALPQAYEEHLLAQGFVPDLGVWRTGDLSDATRVRSQLAIKETALVELLEGDDWDCAFVVFKCLDVLSHQAWSEHTSGPVAQLAIELDRVLGSLLKAAGPGTDVLLVSDHGFARYPKVLDLEALLRQEGWSIPREGSTGSSRVQGPLASARPAQHDARMAELDLARCIALSQDAEGNFGSLRLNLVGREPEGLVETDLQGQVLEELGARLLELRVDGEPLIEEVWTSDHLMPGPARAALPDLVLRTRPEVRVVVGSGERVLTASPRPFPDHAFEGIAIMAGPSIRPAPSRGRWNIADVTPTVLHLLGQPLHTEMSGSSHGEILATPRRVQVVPRAKDPTLRPRAAAGDFRKRSSDEQRLLMEALQAMGYAGEVPPTEPEGAGE